MHVKTQGMTKAEVLAVSGQSSAHPSVETAWWLVGTKSHGKGLNNGLDLYVNNVGRTAKPFEAVASVSMGENDYYYTQGNTFIIFKSVRSNVLVHTD